MKKVVILHTAIWEQAMGGAELQILYLIQELKKVNVEISKVPKKQRSLKFADRKNKRRKKLVEKSSFKNRYKAFKK